MRASRLHRIAGCLAILLLALSWIPAAVAADILYVANVPLNAADQSIVDYVRAKGHYVLVIDDSAAVPDTTSTELIMISESVDPAVVGTKFNNLPVRILDWDAEMQYVLGMTGPTVETDFGYSTDDVRAHLVDHNHPLAGGLTGNDLVVFTGTAKPMGWGEPNKNAQIVARQVLAGKRPLLYEYAPGAKLVDGTNAPSNRIFFFMADNGIFGMTSSGKAFLDAILGYSITGGDFTAPVITPPANIFIEAVTLNDTIVNYPPATVTDNRDPNPTVSYSKASGTLFPLGVTTVVITAADNVGNQSTASFTITIADTTPPTIGGGNIINGNLTAEATSAAGAVVTFVGATDILDPNPTIVANPPSGSQFSLGVTTVNVTATDSSNNTATGSFTVTVKDTTAPQLTVPANVIADAEDASGATVNYPPATATDAVTANPTITYSKNSGTHFPMGYTTVIVTAKDAAGNTRNGSFTVRVINPNAPLVDAGTDKYANAAIFQDATVTSGGVTFQWTQQSGPAGGTLTFSSPNTEDTFISANVEGTYVARLTSCNQDGISAFDEMTLIWDVTPPSISLTTNNVTAEATGPNGAIVNYDPATVSDTSPYTVSYSQNSGTLFPLGTTPVTVTATDAAGNIATATISVCVQDTTPPVINPGVTAEATGPNGAVVNYIGATDLVDPNPSIVSNPPVGSLFPLGDTLVTVSATDFSGNTANGSFLVHVVDTTAPTFTSVPSDQVVEATNFYGAVVTYPPATATDTVSNVTITYSKDSGAEFPLGQTIVTVTATDEAGNSATATFKVTVQDTTPPVIGEDGNIINGNLTVEATGPNGAVVNFVGASDLADPNPTIVANPPSGSLFPLGVTTVSVTATDASGNSASGSFTITVVDTTGPTFTSVPSDQVAEATSAAGAVVNYPAATATDLVSAVTITYSKDSGTTFPLGDTIVTVTAKDQTGNTTTATFKVTVQDTTPPTIGDDGSGFGSGDIVNGNMTVEATSPQGAVVIFRGATDLVDPNPTIVANPPSGSQFPIGVTTVNVTATDAAGNSASGSFTVTVVDTTGPVLSNIPADITIEATTPTGQTVTYSPASATDLTSTPSITYSKPSGSFFSLGDTIVTITATDAYNNSTNATFKVTVTPDHTPPVIIVPPNVTTEATNNGGAHVDYPPADTGDATDVDYDHPSGSHFPVGTTTVTVTATDDSGNTSTATFTVTVLDTHAPVIESPLTANPNPGVAGEPVIFTIIATDAQPLTYTWNFGDGTTLVESTGQVSHTFSAPSNYPVTVTVSDPGGLKATDTLELTVNVPADLNGPGTSVARTKLPMLVTKLIGGAMFSKTGADRYMIAGFIPNTSKEFNPLGKTLILDVNGALTPFKLDAKGRAKTGTGRLTLKLKYKRNKATKKKEFVGGAIPFLARVSKGSWVNNWKSAGVNPSLSVKKGSINMLVDMTLDEVVYTSGSKCQYDAKAQKSGRFKYIYRKPRK
jgi:hypothetical protein